MKYDEIWDVNFLPQKGDEIKKIRPAVIVNNNAVSKLKLKIVVPFTDGLRSLQEWHVGIEASPQNGLHKFFMLIAFKLNPFQKTGL